MKRREFITGLGSTAAAWPVAASAQQEGRMRRIAVLIRGVETDGVVQAQLGALREVLVQRGWTEGRNVRFEIRWYDDDPVLLHVHADELVRLAPDAIFAGSRPSALALLQRTRTIPIIFFNVGDPTEGGILKILRVLKAMPLARPACITRSPANGLNCSRRPHRASTGSRSFSSPESSGKSTSPSSTRLRWPWALRWSGRRTAMQPN